MIINNFRVTILVVLALCLFAHSIGETGNASTQRSISTDNKQANSGNHYLIISQENASAHWTLNRPDQNDRTIVLSIPAAFTGHHGEIIGFYALQGKCFNNPSPGIGGIVNISDGNCKVNEISGGNIPEGLSKDILDCKSEAFQQFQVVKNNKPEKFKDNSHFQRRCIAIMNDGKTAVIESTESITLSQFAQDLVDIGVQQAAYTDMGLWDEGWYRDLNSSRPVVIGHDRRLTNKQSNWFYLQAK